MWTELSKNLDIYIVSITCSGQIQKPNILKNGTDSQRTVVLSSKERAHKSLISDRNPGYKVRGVIYDL
jgi:hypothetical protein